MSPWARVRPGVEVSCGGCGASIDAGVPVYHVVVALGQRLKHPLARCETCVGPAPPDLPALVARAPDAGAAMTPVARLVTDWQTRAAGREPGEDD